MPEDMEMPEVTGISNNENTQLTEQMAIPSTKPKKTVNDWLRDMRMSSSVNKTTLGVESERVTPDVMLAASKKLLKINRREAESDPKDSLEFQRIYGPTDYFAEHILRDAGRVGRQLLWKATNKGGLDFMQPGALDQHVSDVFNESKLTNMVDASSPLESVEASYKVTRLGEGGVASTDSAPTEMRLVQPSFLGFIDPVRSVECHPYNHLVFTNLGWKKIADITTDDLVACLIDGRLEYHHPEQVVSYAYDGELYCFDNGTIAYKATGNHRMWCRKHPHKERMTKRGWKKAYEPQFEFEYAENIHNTNRIFQTGGHLPLIHGKRTSMVITSDEDMRIFDMKDWCAFLGWYVAEGCIKHTDKYRRALSISQSTHVNPENCEEIAQLLHRLCIHYRRTDTSFEICSRALYNELEPLGYCDDKYIPEEVFDSPEEAQWAFIDALLKGDGEKQKTGLPILHTTSKRLADDYERLLFQLGYAVSRSDRPDNRQPQYKHMYRVRVLQAAQAWLYKNGHKITEREQRSDYYYREYYKNKVYCLTVPGGLFYTKIEGRHGFWTGNSLRVGLDAYITKNCMKGSDGKLYQKFINAHTGKEELVDSETAAKSVVTTPDMMQAKTNHIYAMGGKTGVRIVKKSDVDYYLPRMDDAFTNASNLVTGLSGVKELRLLMGCLHPLTNILCVDDKKVVSLVPASVVNSTIANILPGATKNGSAENYEMRTSVAKLPGGRNWFRKVVLFSGRTLITSKDHKWSVLRKGEQVLVPADKLKPGDRVLRSMFKDLPNRRMFINKQLVTRDVAILMGYAVRTLRVSEGKFVITYNNRHKERLDRAIEKLQLTDNVKFYRATDYRDCISFTQCWFTDWLTENIGIKPQDRNIPREILSADLPTVCCFMDAYTADENQVAVDSAECTWIINIPNTLVRDGLSYLLARMGTDTYYRDAYLGNGEYQLALKLLDSYKSYGDCVLDEVKSVLSAPNAPIMIDIDVNDNLYAVANGIITHNSKYPQQAISLAEREAPYVRNIDEASGLDMHSRIGKYLGARYASKPGTVAAVRKDRIDMIYDDGTKGSVGLYENFPMNNKGFITNTPQVKAGQHIGKGGLLASSNYTDKDGVAALGLNLRTGWISWKGGTYEDAIVISESTAKRLTSDTMYATDLDLDKTIALGKNNYLAWKPSEYTKDQLSILDNDGIVRPGSIVRKGDPLVLAVRRTEPSPGTMGKRLLTDLSQTWDHDHPGIVTDIVRTKSGVKVLAKVTAPAEVGDKLSNGYGNKGVISCYDDQTEIFTRRGWIKFKDLTVDDSVATRMSDGKAEFIKPEAIMAVACDEDLYAYKGDQLDFCVTGNHKMYVGYDNTHGMQLKEAQECYGGKYYVKTLLNLRENQYGTKLRADGNVRITYDKGRGKVCNNIFSCGDFCKFLGIYLAEGCVSYTETYSNGTKVTSYSVQISQKRGVDQESNRRCNDIEELLENMGVKWVYHNGYYRIRNKALYQYLKPLGHAQNKYLPINPYDMDKVCLQYLFDWYYMGDGNKVDVGRSVCSASPRLISDMCVVATLLGYRAKVKVQHVAGKWMHNYDMNVLTIGGTDNAHILTNQWKKQSYHGTVYCVQSATGIIYVRRNGKPMWCGNCILPDDEMPVDKDGKPLELLMSPLGLVSRCYDECTEFLTDNGWKLGKDITDTDLLACYDPQMDRTTWLLQSEPFHKSQYKGRMYGAHNNDIDFLVTPHHKVHVWKDSTIAQELFVEDVYHTDVMFPDGEGNRLKCSAANWYMMEDYDGFVYCPTVPTGFVLTRRNGRTICMGNTNPAQLTETLLGKVAHKTGKTQTIPAFYNGNMHDYVMEKLKQNRLSADDDFFDPETGRKIPNVVNGYSYIYKLKHMAESKEDARGTDDYTADETPGSSSKRFGTLEVGALVSHGAFDTLLDNKLIRGQNNSDFWRNVRTGGIPTIPGEPLVQKKFFAYLQGSGVNVRKTPKGVSVFALSNSDVSELAGPREVKSRDTYEAKTFRPIAGGLFGQDVFGPNGDKWAYIKLDEPVPNPVMAEPLARLLRMTDKDFVACATGQKEVDGIRGPEQLKKRLSEIDLASEARTAMNEFKTSPASKKDATLKRYVAIENMRRQGVQPAEYMLDKIPVVPPIYRPISEHAGVTMVADANYLYAQLLDARDDLRDSKMLPQEYQDKARANLYRTWNELTGLYDPEDVKLRNKNVGGLLQWALGKGSPKTSAFHRKVLGSTVDTVGRGTIVPDSRMTIDQIGIPVSMAMDMMAPFVERKLVNAGYSPVDAMKLVKKRDQRAMSMLNEVIETHPVEMNRAPTLHKFNIMAFKPVLVQGHAIHVAPAICPGFNADFDGDAVNIHVPVSDNARKEAMNRMRPSRNLIAPSNRKIINKPEKEYIQGLYIATRMGEAPNGRAQIFRTYDEAKTAYRNGAIDIDTPIQILENK